MVLSLPGNVHSFVWEKQNETDLPTKEIPHSRALHSHLHVHRHVLNTSGCEWNRNATRVSQRWKAAHRHFKKQQQLIWEKPVFVTYRVTCPCQNAIYAKHAPDGKKRTREEATRESWTQKNAAVVFINEERSSLWWNKRTGMRRQGDNGMGVAWGKASNYQCNTGAYVTSP